ncbi:MAG TPA: hypothetical protein V6D30_21285 [Leptolyngbyaceae cyanobacterium]
MKAVSWLRLVYIAVAKAIRIKPNTETLTPQSFPFCQVTERVEVLPYALCLLLYFDFCILSNEAIAQLG